MRPKAIALKTMLLIMTSAVVIASFAAIAVFTRQSVRDSAVQAEVKRARGVALQAESVRDYMAAASASGIYDQQKLRTDVKALVRTVPIVSAMDTARQKAKEAGFEFRSPKEFPRNLKNEPDAIELPVLRGLQARAALDATPETYLIDPAKNAIRYFRAIRLTQDCLACHGSPSTAKQLWGRDDGTDPTGVKMEGWKEGEVHGAFEVIMSLDGVDATVARLTTWTAAASALACIVVVLFTIAFLRKFIFTRLDRAAERMRAVAAGDLTVQVEDDRNDELGETFEAFNSMTGQLRELVGKIQQGVSGVDAAAREIATANEDLAFRTEQQSGSVQETAASMEEISSTITQTATGAHKANADAKVAEDAAAGAGAAVKKVIEAMLRIDKSAGRIGEVIQVIDEIAFQTNLLALNASVEAARAGELGRGFAVVASEVRNLALRCAAAAKEVRALVQESVAHSSEGAQVANKSAASLAGMLESVSGLTKAVALISGASQEQSLGVGEVTKAVAQLDDTTQQNAALVEEMAAAARSLQQQAADLSGAVARFRTGNGLDAGGPARKAGPAKKSLDRADPAGERMH